MIRRKSRAWGVFTAFIFGLTMIYVVSIFNGNNGDLLSQEIVRNNYVWADFEAQEFGRDKIASQSLGTIYYVDQSRGDDSNPGTTENLPFKTIQRANKIVAEGDTVYVKNGTYNENITITQSGNPNNWIVFQAFPDHKPFVIGTQDGTFRISGNYIKIIGLRISSTELGSGIHVGKGNHHTQIIKNEIHNSGCGGISGQETDYLYIEGNIVYKNAFRSPYQCSGISIYQAQEFDNKPGFHNIIRGNISYANENKLAKDNGKVTDGNGIIIDDFRHTQNQSKIPKYTAWTLIENNLVFDNGGRGIHVFQSDNVVVRNNTTFKNLKSSNLEGHLNGELTTYFSSNVHFYNNIVYATDKSKKTLVDDYSSKNKWDYNLSYNGSILITDGHSDSVLGNNNLIDVDPVFINPSIIPNAANFSLQATSPAIDAGTSINASHSDFDAKIRPLGSGYDIGAYEFK